MLAKGDGSGSEGVRLVELLAALSLATDLGLGLPQEHVLRQTTIATRLAALAGLSDAQRVAVDARCGCAVRDEPRVGRAYRGRGVTRPSSEAARTIG